MKARHTETKENDINRYNILTGREPKGKCPHSLSLNVSRGLQNAGKWWCTINRQYIARYGSVFLCMIVYMW